MTLDNNSSEGATARFRLPRLAAKRQDNMIRSDFTVFLIDDDPSVLKALTRLLQTEGYKTQAFSSPQIFSANMIPPFQAAQIIDVAMPRSAMGSHFSKRLQARQSSGPIIFPERAWQHSD